MKTCAAWMLLAVSSVAFGQAAPAGVAMSPAAGTPFPAVDGIFHYSLSASEVAQIGYRGSGAGFSTILSGNAAYNTKNVARPFSMLYSGGLFMGNQYGQSVTTFQNLAISQSLVTGSWVFGISDSVSYLPQSPTTGLSGIPGVGDLGSLPLGGPSSGPAGGVLTNDATNVSNALSGSVMRRLTPLTSLNGTGAWSILRFPDGTGLDSSDVMGEVGLSHQLDVRDTVSGNATYSVFSYGSGIGLSIESRGLNAVYSRVLSHTLTMSASAGPAWISSSDSALVPSSVILDANVNLGYTRRVLTASLSYARGINGGSGVQPGALSDTVVAVLGRSYGRDWMASVNADYTHTSGLVQTAALAQSPPAGYPFLYAGGTGSTVYGGLQVSRRLSNSLSTYASYNLQHQSIDNSLAAQNAFSGLSQTFGIGISFSPRATRLGQF